MGGIRGALAAVDGTSAMAELKSTGVLKLDINGTEVELAETDLLIEAAKVEGFISESDGGVTVVELK